MRRVPEAEEPGRVGGTGEGGVGAGRHEAAGGRRLGDLEAGAAGEKEEEAENRTKAGRQQREGRHCLMHQLHKVGLQIDFSYLPWF